MMMYGDEAARAALARGADKPQALALLMLEGLKRSRSIVTKGGLYRDGDQVSWSIDTIKPGPSLVGRLVVTCNNPVALALFTQSARGANCTVVGSTHKDTVVVMFRP